MALGAYWACSVEPGFVRRTHRVTWPAGGMCRQGEKREEKGGKKQSSALRLMSVSHSLPPFFFSLSLSLLHGHSSTLILSLDALFCSVEAMRREQVWSLPPPPHPPLRGETSASFLCSLLAAQCPQAGQRAGLWGSQWGFLLCFIVLWGTDLVSYDLYFNTAVASSSSGMKTVVFYHKVLWVLMSAVCGAQRPHGSFEGLPTWDLAVFFGMCSATVFRAMRQNDEEYNTGWNQGRLLTWCGHLEPSTHTDL